MVRWFRLSIRLFWLVAAGCTSVPETNEHEPVVLPRSRLSSDSVVLEIAFVTVPDAQPAWLARVWNEIDEQVIPPEARRTLLSNGLRSGVVGPQLPVDLRTALDQRQRGGIRGMFGEAPFDDTELHPQLRRLQLRAGKRSEIVTTSEQDCMVVLIDDGSRVVGKSFTQAQCKLALEVVPKASGRVQLNLTPEIHHGPSRQKWIGRDGAFRLEAGREREVFGSLSCVVELAAGDALVLTSSGPAKSLGGNAFGTPEHAAQPQKMLLIRLAQSQVDDLVAPLVVVP